MCSKYYVVTKLTPKVKHYYRQQKFYILWSRPTMWKFITLIMSTLASGHFAKFLSKHPFDTGQSSELDVKTSRILSGECQVVLTTFSTHDFIHIFTTKAFIRTERYFYNGG